MNNIKNENTVDFYAVLFHIALSTTIFQLICPFYASIKYFRPDYICIMMLVTILCFDIYRKGLSSISSILKGVFSNNRLLVILCIAYFCWDTITVFYAKDPLLLVDKYLIWAKISALAFFLLYYVYKSDDAKKCKLRVESILLNLGLTACAVSIIAYIGYYTETFTFYDRILTTIADHNFFSSGIMFGYICLCYVVIFNDKLTMAKKMILICVGTIICVPAMYLSASRRTIILMWFFLGGFCIYVFYYILSKEKKAKAKLIILMCVLGVTSNYLCNAHISFFEKYSYQRNLETISKFENATENTTENATEAGVSEYVDTISDGSGLDLRIMIWKSSLAWFEELTPIQKLIGGGASYHYDVFNQLDDEKNLQVVQHYSARINNNSVRWMYPHNFFLEELLMGGIIKLVLVIAIMLEILCRIIIAIRKGDDRYSILLLALYATLFGNLIMGGKFGLFGNRFTWIIISLDLAIRCINRCNNYKNSSLKGVYNE